MSQEIVVGFRHVPPLLDIGEHLLDRLVPLQTEAGHDQGGGPRLTLHAVNQHRGPEAECAHYPRGRPSEIHDVELLLEVVVQEEVENLDVRTSLCPFNDTSLELWAEDVLHAPGGVHDQGDAVPLQPGRVNGSLVAPCIERTVQWSEHTYSSLTEIKFSPTHRALPDQAGDAGDAVLHGGEDLGETHSRFSFEPLYNTNIPGGPWPRSETGSCSGTPGTCPA